MSGMSWDLPAGFMGIRLEKSISVMECDNNDQHCEIALVVHECDDKGCEPLFARASMGIKVVSVKGVGGKFVKYTAHLYSAALGPTAMTHSLL